MESTKKRLIDAWKREQKRYPLKKFARQLAAEPAHNLATVARAWLERKGCRA